MAMVDYAIEQGIADPTNPAWAAGPGGISTDFITQTTRFKAAIPAWRPESPASTATTNT
jgi:hypothetical protein